MACHPSVPDTLPAQFFNDTEQYIVSGVPVVARWHKKFIRKLPCSFSGTKNENVKCFACFNIDNFQKEDLAFRNQAKTQFREK